MSELTVEQELVEITKFKPKKGLERQDHLAAIVKAADLLSDDDFDGLSEEASNWVTKAADALNKKREIPEFPDAEEGGEDDDPEAPEDEDENEDHQSSAQNGALRAESPDEEQVGEAEEVDEPEPEPEEDPDKVVRIAKRIQKAGKSPAQRKREERARKAIPTRADSITGERDRYGIHVGTKTHDAILLYEKGASIRDVHEEIGGKFANILKQLAEAGHRVEKDPDTKKFTLTHKDDISAPRKGTKKADLASIVSNQHVEKAPAKKKAKK